MYIFQRIAEQGRKRVLLAVALVCLIALTGAQATFASKTGRPDAKRTPLYQVSDNPEQLSTRDPFDVVLGGDYVIWTELPTEFCTQPGSVRAVNLSTGTESTWREGCDISPANIVADHTHVFYTEWDTDTIQRIPTGGGPSTTVASATGLIFHRALALDDTYVYFGDDEGIKRVSREGGTVTTLAAGYDAAKLAVDDTDVYWTERSPGGGGAIRYVSKEGGSVTTLLSGSSLDDPWGITTDNTHVYWTELGGGRLRRVAKTGGTITDLAPAESLRQGGDLAVNTDYVYWVDTTGAPDGRLRRVPKAGGTIESLVLALFGPVGVNLSATHVYWGDLDGIWRLAFDADRSEVDTDGDGLIDNWEISGLDADDNGTIDVDLPAMGADPIHKDIFVEIDYMVDTGDSFSYQPDAGAIEDIVEAFDNAPVSNPDATTGIHLHVDYGPTAPLTWGSAATWGSLSDGDELSYERFISTCDSANNFNWSGFDTIKMSNFDSDRQTVFHYNVWANSLCSGKLTVSGISRGIPTSDFIVSLGEWSTRAGTRDQQAGTFMHELGHNLGLRHGGSNNRNYKPNYLSVMSYAFQTRGLLVDETAGHFDYSRYALASLGETSLNEPAGLSIPALDTRMLGTLYYCGGTLVNDLDAEAVDWNCDDDEVDTGLSLDINGDTLLTTLQSYDDWTNLVFDGGSLGLGGETIILPLQTKIEEIDFEENERLPELPPKFIYLPLIIR